MLCYSLLILCECFYHVVKQSARVQFSAHSSHGLSSRPPAEHETQQGLSVQSSDVARAGLNPGADIMLLLVHTYGGVVLALFSAPVEPGSVGLRREMKHEMAMTVWPCNCVVRQVCEPRTCGRSRTSW